MVIVAVGSMVALAAMAYAPWSPAQAQDRYPSRTIRVVIPFAAGSGSDLIARVVGETIATQMGVSVVPEVLEGAGGAIGAAAVAKAQPDGYMLLSAATPMTVGPYLVKTLPYDPAKDFTAITRVSVIPLVLVTSSKAPWQSFQELIAHMRSNPGKVNYATGGKGSPSHLEVELMINALGLQAQDIPYKNFGQALTDVMGGRADFIMVSLPITTSHIQAGNLRALAVGSATRVPTAASVPTMAEAMNRPGYEATVWYGFAGPAGMHADIAARLDQEIRRVAGTAAVRARIEQVGCLLSLAGPAEFGLQIRSESEKWAAIVKRLKLNTE